MVPKRIELLTELTRLAQDQMTNYSFELHMTRIREGSLVISTFWQSLHLNYLLQVENFGIIHGIL